MQAGSIELILCRPPFWLYPSHLFFSTSPIRIFGQKYFSIKFYSDSYLLIVISRCILGIPLSLGMKMTIGVSNRLRVLALSSAIEVIL